VIVASYVAIAICNRLDLCDTEYIYMQLLLKPKFTIEAPVLLLVNRLEPLICLRIMGYLFYYTKILA